MIKVVQWLSNAQLDATYTAGYWNDIQAEKKKPWWIADGQYQMCMDFITHEGLYEEFQNAIEMSGLATGNGQYKVVDIAAGICWTSALLSKLKGVQEVHAVELSKHRIELLAPHAFRMFDGDTSKFYRYVGSFYELHLPDDSYDIIFMSQAFHHADKPLKLLMECDRILRRGGKIILIGEHFINSIKILKKFCAALIKKRYVAKSFCQLFPPDPLLGDHYYRISDYHFIFTTLGYQIEHRYIKRVGRAIFLATKP